MSVESRNNIKEFRGAQWVMCIIVFVVLLVPFAAMPWASDDSSLENRELAEMPAVRDNSGNLNVEILSDWGEFFSDHFAFRNELVDLDARLYSSLFGISTTNQVVVGDDGWLYYAGTLNDYQARSPLRERQAHNIAYNLRMIQNYCEANGSTFSFLIAPDKNAIYGEHMPSYYPSQENPSMALLKEQLQELGVNYVDLFEVFENQESLLYFLRDSHWNEKGALLAQNEILQSLGAETLTIREDQFIAADTYLGDLNQMIFPISAVPETNWYIEGINDGSGSNGGFRSGYLWEYTEGSNTEDDVIRTASNTKTANANDTLVMYRDSFANNLIPYFATEFKSALFTKMLPYNMLVLPTDKPDAVIVERAQRHVSYLGENAPLMPCPTVRLPSVEQSAGGMHASCEIGENGPMLSFSGTIDGGDGVDDEVFVRLTGSKGDMRTYRAFAITDSESENDWGYNIYVSKSVWQGQTVKAEVIVGKGESYTVIGEFEFEISR